MNKRLLVKLSQMYYDQNLNQKEISESLGISRAQISRLLQKAREENIVKIQINDPFMSESEVEKKLIALYHLSDALVLNTAGTTRESLLEEFGLMSGPYLENYIKDGDSVGVMSGRTISAVIKGTKHFSRKKLVLIPMVGGLGNQNSSWHANSIAQIFAGHTNSVSYILNAPSVMQNEAGKNLLIEEPEVKSVLNLGANCRVAIVGIGRVENGASNVVAGSLSRQDIIELNLAGAASSMCISYFDKSGHIIHPEIERRMIGQTVESIKKSKTIAIAIGKSKAGAIDAALKSGYVDVFITNMETANHIITQGQKEETP